jgi:hypothetical protein
MSYQIDPVIAFDSVWRFDVESLRGSLRLERTNHELALKQVHFFLKNYRQTPRSPFDKAEVIAYVTPGGTYQGFLDILRK